MKTKLALLTAIFAAILSARPIHAAESKPAPAPAKAAASDKFALDYPETKWGRRHTVKINVPPVRTNEVRQVILEALKAGGWVVENSNDSLIIGSWQNYPVYVKYDSQHIDIYARDSYVTDLHIGLLEKATLEFIYRDLMYKDQTNPAFLTIPSVLRLHQLDGFDVKPGIHTINLPAGRHDFLVTYWGGNQQSANYITVTGDFETGKEYTMEYTTTGNILAGKRINVYIPEGTTPTTIIVTPDADATGNPQGMIFTLPGDVSKDLVQKALTSAFSTRQWKVTATTGDSVTGSITVRGNTATMVARHDQRKIIVIVTGNGQGGRAPVNWILNKRADIMDALKRALAGQP